jgi:beta-galactosidase
LCAYAANGGHLLVTFRSGYANPLARARHTRAPGPLRAALGTSYQEFTNLAEPLHVQSSDPSLVLPADARATAWADGLLLEGAQALVAYDHPYFGRFPAVTTHPYGAGRVTYVGTLPNPALGAAVARWVLDQAGVHPWPSGLPDSVRVCTGTTTEGTRVCYVFNWSADCVEVTLPVAANDVLAGEAVSANTPLALGPWDVRVLIAGDAATALAGRR